MESADAWEAEEPERIMISALEHYSYCPRQCALIHLEHLFDENIYTLRGRLAHERVDTLASRQEESIRVERAFPLWSQRLGLIGRADVVEFHGQTPYPVEYKLGKRREWRYEALQVCAQGMCLEEMFGLSVTHGAIYYCASRTRREISFDAMLRSAVEEATVAVQAMLRGTALPSAPNDQRCEKCSLLESCLPGAVAQSHRVHLYEVGLFQVADSLPKLDDRDP
ncbi:MAG TPA: CRISPR-associated protein Cas4 [Ktedonobacterales bacterium]|nr:CRISPR-associated protein Cas4 [Ktedonobacterales bacterium]